MRYFPLYFDMSDAHVAVVGGSETALQKVRLLMKSPARITLIAPELDDDLQNLVRSGVASWDDGFPTLERLEGFQLIYAAAGPRLNIHVAELANQLNVPVNVVDDPEHCSFITPAIVDRSPVTVAIGTEGAAPILAQNIKTEIEKMLSPRLGELTTIAGRLRERVARTIAIPAARRAYWQWFFKDVFGSFDVRSTVKKATQYLDDACRLPLDEDGTEPGQVYLVGAGAGTSDLLTFKAARLLQNADVIVYDRLVDPSVMEVARRDARMIYVGKAPGQPCTAQETINEILVREALEGHNVVRLKCGDPLIFGRGSEEMNALDDAGIQYEIVPGITAASACAAYAKLPLTTREGVRSLIFLTGHSTEGLTPYDWSGFARNGTMLVLYMGVKMAAKIEANLLAVGVRNGASVTIVENGARETSRCFHTQLGRITQLMKNEKIQHPAMIYISVELAKNIMPLPENEDLPQTVLSEE